MHNSPPIYLPIRRLPSCGKRNYIAPEVFRGDPFYFPMLTDIWAAGIMLFMVLTGLPPVESAQASDERYCMIGKRGR